jgi:hypothetical protein
MENVVKNETRFGGFKKFIRDHKFGMLVTAGAVIGTVLIVAKANGSEDSESLIPDSLDVVA